VSARFLGIITALASRISHPIAQSNTGPLPSTNLLELSERELPVGVERVPDSACHCPMSWSIVTPILNYAISMSKARHPTKKARRQSAVVCERIRFWRAPITQLVVCVSTG
jgi:hypothetical protein